MKESFTVKGRIHHGSKSLDLTIPAKFVEKYKINPGDIFKVIILEEKGKLVVNYERVFINQ
jgi:hypothetical protein